MLWWRSRGWAKRARPSAATLLASLLLTDCATHPPAPPPPAAAGWAQRQVQLRAEAGHFSLGGRLAATHGSDGISAGIRWQQLNEHAHISLSGPLGFGGARVQLDGSALHIQTNDGRELAGDAADAELSRLLGFDPPLRSLRFWAVGVPDPNSTGAPETQFDAQQRLSRLAQNGWSIVYDAYMNVGSQWLPRRLTLTRDDLRLRLVINDWQL